jgi:hypothetical protein
MPDTSVARPSSARWAELLWVLFGALACALIWTWPLCTELDSVYPFDARFTPSPRGSDTHQYLWNLWWVRQALESGQDPFWCPLIFHPRGHSLALHTHAFACGLASWPLQQLCGMPAAYNLIGLLGTVAAAGAAYALGRALGLGRVASALLAFSWAYSPYFQQKAQEHLSYAAHPWPPLLLLALLRWRRAVDGAPAHLAALCCGAIAGLALLTDPIGCAWLLVLGALFAWIAPDRVRAAQLVGAASTATARERALRWVRGLALAALAFALVGAPYLRALWHELASLADFDGPDLLGRGQIYHAQLSDFVHPSGLHPLFRGLGAGAPLEGAQWPGARAETSSLTLGCFVLLAAAVGAWFDSRARRALCVALPLFLLCWDPGPDPEGWLSALYRQLPGLDALRVPSRAFACLHLPVCLAAAVGAEQLLQRERGRGRGRMLVALLCALGVFEWWRVAPDLAPWSVPSAVSRIARDPGQGAVCVLPFRPGSYVSMSWQTVHGKPVTWSYIARVHPGAIEAWRAESPQLFAFAIGEALPDVAALARELDALEIDHLLVPLDELENPERITGVLDRLSGWEQMPADAAESPSLGWWRRSSAGETHPR